MTESAPSARPPLVRVTNRFVRHRNVLVAEADCSALFEAYEQHCNGYGIQNDPAHDRLFRELLAGFTLHAASHPRNEVLAWTIHFQDPHLNCFLAGDTQRSSVTGRVFTDGLKKEDSNMFYQELVVRGKPMHRSIVPFEGTSPKGSIEFFYSQSEQRPGKFFHLGEGRYCLLSAHPDYDAVWFRNLGLESIHRLAEEEVLSVIETRDYGWQCGCHHQKILDILRHPMMADPEGLFGSDPAITVNCPRCAAKYRVTREAMEAVVEAET